MASKKQPKRQRVSGGDNPGVEYRAWLGTVSADERMRIATLLSQHKLETYKDMGGFIQIVMVELIRGNVTPAVSQELRYWADTLFTVLTLEHSANRTVETAGENVIAALLAVARTPLPQPVYQQAEREILRGQVIDASQVG